MYPFPEPNPFTKLSAPQPGGYADWSSKLVSYLIRCSYRHLWATYQSQGLSLPGHTELADWMYTHAADRALEWISGAKLERLAQIAATRALDESRDERGRRRGYDPEFRARAAKGGRHSAQSPRRRPKYTVDMLDGLEGLSKAQQAAQLGCSTATIAHLRRLQADPDLRILDALEKKTAHVGKLAPEQSLEDMLAEVIEDETFPNSQNEISADGARNAGDRRTTYVTDEFKRIVTQPSTTEWLYDLATEMRQEQEARIRVDAFDDLLEGIS